MMAKAQTSPDQVLAQSLRVLADRLARGAVMVLDWHERTGRAKTPRSDRGKWAKKKLAGDQSLTVRFRERGD